MNVELSSRRGPPVGKISPSEIGLCLTLMVQCLASALFNVVETSGMETGWHHCVIAPHPYGLHVDNIEMLNSLKPALSVCLALSLSRSLSLFILLFLFLSPFLSLSLYCCRLLSACGVHVFFCAGTVLNHVSASALPDVTRLISHSSGKVCARLTKTYDDSGIVAAVE